jgi:hypothetical protein
LNGLGCITLCRTVKCVYHGDLVAGTCWVLS